MMKSGATISLVFLLAAGSSAAAGDVVEVRVVHTAQAVEPATPPVVPEEWLKDAKVLASIETSRDGAGDVHARCAIGDATVALDGHVKATPDGKARRLRITFSYKNGSGTQEVSTIVVLALNTPTRISGLSAAGEGARLIIATVKPDKAAGGKAD